MADKQTVITHPLPIGSRSVNGIVGKFPDSDAALLVQQAILISLDRDADHVDQFARLEATACAVSQQKAARGKSIPYLKHVGFLAG